MKPVLNADTSAWRRYYTDALFQEDATKLPLLIARAEFEIVTRARLLFETPADNAGELRALDNALHMLNVLKLCLNSNKQPATLAKVKLDQTPVLGPCEANPSWPAGVSA